MAKLNKEHIKRLITSKSILAYTVSSLMFFGLIAFAEKKHSNRLCEDLIIRLQNNHINRFVTESQVRNMLNKEETRPIEGQPLDRINLRKLE